MRQVTSARGQNTQVGGRRDPTLCGFQPPKRLWGRSRPPRAARGRVLSACRDQSKQLVMQVVLHRERGKPRKAPSDCSRSSRLIASPCVLGLRTDAQTILGADTELPAWKVLALPPGRSVGMGRVPTARLACCLTCGLHSTPTQNKLDGPSMEERWLEEVSSKDRFSSAALGGKFGWRVGGRT